MAYALVGTIGTAVQTAATTALTTWAWGASETRAAGNLLSATVTVTGSATLPTTPSGWFIARQVAGTSCSATVYWKIAAGSDGVPTIAAITSGLIAGQLGEFSGNHTTSPLDANGSATATSSPVTATNNVPSSATSDLILACGADRRSVARATVNTWTSNHATFTLAGNNNSVSSVDHYSMAYATSLSSISGADTAIMTLSITTSITGLAVAAATFRVPGDPFVQPSRSQINPILAQ